MGHALSSKDVSTPTPLISPLFCCGGGEEFVGAVQAAAPGVEIIRVGPEDLAVPGIELGHPLVVLCDVDDETVAQVRALRDEAGLPRWPVVRLSGCDAVENAPPEALPRPQWTPDGLARAFAAEIARHELERENAQLRGDLLSFGSRVAHDLRTPLGGVMTSAEMLREILAEGAPADASLTQPILDSVDGLARLVERVSRFAKAIGTRPALEPFDVGTAFWNAFQQLEGRILKAGAELRQPKQWPQAIGSAALTEMVWRELLQNGLEHGGAAARMEAGSSPDVDGIRFWVWNSVAVAEGKRRALFHPFNQLHASGAPRGLGLAMVRRLVELQHGHCGFEVPATGGSQFYFVLPAPR